MEGSAPGLDTNVMLQVMPLFNDPRVEISAQADIRIPPDALEAWRSVFAQAFDQIGEDSYRMDGPGTRLEIRLYAKTDDETPDEGSAEVSHEEPAQTQAP